MLFIPILFFFRPDLWPGGYRNRFLGCILPLGSNETKLKGSNQEQGISYSQKFSDKHIFVNLVNNRAS